MNILDLKSVIANFNIVNLNGFIMPDSNSVSNDKYEVEYFFEYCGLKFKFWNKGNNVDYVIVERVPFKILTDIFQKYPNNMYEIYPKNLDRAYERADQAVLRSIINDVTINGFDNSLVIPVVDAQYEKELEQIGKLADEGVSVEECWNLQVKALACMYDRMSSDLGKNNYVRLCQINTRDGLIVFLIELAHYFGRDTKTFEELSTEITMDILAEVNPGVLTDIWMSANGVDQFNNNVVGKDFREVLIEFDNLVNPYMMSNAGKVELASIYDYVDKVSVSGRVYDDKNNVGCGELYITEFKTKNRVCFKRFNSGFSSQLDYKISNDDMLKVVHYVGNYCCDKGSFNEVIYLKHYGSSVKEPFELKYNITTGMVETLDGNVALLTMEQRQFIYRMLLQANIYAKSVTVEYMKVNNKVNKTKKMFV